VINDFVATLKCNFIKIAVFYGKSIKFIQIQAYLICKLIALTLSLPIPAFGSNCREMLMTFKITATKGFKRRF
jgi:hypothetical protein